MEIQQLRGFYYSAKLGSLTGAAEKLSITQSAVSQQIKSLEEELEVQLFNRYGPRKELTPNGSTFFNCCQRRAIAQMTGNQINFACISAQ